MRYLQATGKLAAGTIEAESAPLADGHVRVAVAYAGVCHSDLAAIAEGEGEFPRRLGHEVSGVVTGTTTDSRPIGTRVAAYVHDGYASEIVVPARRTVPLHSGCSMLDGALAEPLACVIGGLEMLSLRDQAQVVLVGAGFMGLLALRYLTAIGHRVVVIEPRLAAQELACSWGADTVIPPAGVTRRMRLAHPVVIEAAGTAAGLQLASDLVAIDGTLGILGYHQSGGGRRTVDMQGWNFRAMRVISLHNRSLKSILTWIGRAQRSAALGVIRPSQLVDARVGLDELAEVFASGHGHGLIKTVLQISGDSG